MRLEKILHWLSVALTLSAFGCDDSSVFLSDGPLGDARQPDAGAHTPDAAAHAPDATAHKPDAASTADAPPLTELPDAGASSTRETARMLGTVDGAANGYYEYLPPGYGDDTLRPLLVFWHGISENGNGTSELTKVRNNGPPKLIHANQWPADRLFVVLSPQHSGDGCPGSNEIQAFLAFAIAHYTVDTHRVYLTGLSCGAIGSWQYVNDHLNEVIAAAVLIAGDPGDPANAGSNWGRHGCGLGVLPIWSFHGKVDTTVYPNNDVNTMTMLENCPSPPRQFADLVLYDGVGHDSWTRTYDLTAGHDIYAWMLSQRKP